MYYVEKAEEYENRSGATSHGAFNGERAASTSVAMAVARFHNDIPDDNLPFGDARSSERRSVEQMMETLEGKKSSLTGISCRHMLDDDAMEMLWQFLRENATTVHLTTLELDKNSMTIQSAVALASAVQAQSCTLIELDLSDNSAVLLKDKGKGLALLVNVLCADTCRLRRLNLSKNGIGTGKQGVVSIGRLLRYNATVQHLSLSHNSLGPRSVDGLLLRANATLLSLDLSYNKLCDAGARSVMAALDSSSQPAPVSILRDLDLTFNKIGPAGAKRICEVLSSNHSRELVRLNVSLNVIGCAGAEAFRWAIRYNHSLTDLNLSRNNICDGVVAIALGLQESEGSKLRRLDLSWNSLSDAGAEHLAHALRGNSVLESLILSSNAIGDTGIGALVDALHSDVALRELDLVGNQLRDATALVNCICHESYKLERLAYEKNNLSPEQEERVVHAFQFLENKRTWMGKLLAGLTQNRMLSLNLKSRDYGDEEMVLLATHLAIQQCTITTAFFNSSRITDRGVTALAHAVIGGRTAATIQRLYFRGLSKLTDLGVASIAQSLSYAECALQCLTLAGCHIGPDGAALLARALERNASVTRLSLAANRLADAGAQTIFAAVLDPPHPRLVALNVAHNHLTDAAVVLLGSLFRMQDLVLEGNDISDAGALDIAKATMGSTSLRCLDMRSNRLSSKGIQVLKLYLQSELILECRDQRPLESANGH